VIHLRILGTYSSVAVMLWSQRVNILNLIKYQILRRYTLFFGFERNIEAPKSKNWHQILRSYEFYGAPPSSRSWSANKTTLHMVSAKPIIYFVYLFGSLMTKHSLIMLLYSFHLNTTASKTHTFTVYNDFIGLNGMVVCYMFRLTKPFLQCLHSVYKCHNLLSVQW
jgi:hypothetical protein